MSNKPFIHPDKCLPEYYQSLLQVQISNMALLKIDAGDPGEFQRIMAEIETAFLKICKKETILAAEKPQATNIIPLKRRSCHA